MTHMENRAEKENTGSFFRLPGRWLPCRLRGCLLKQEEGLAGGVARRRFLIATRTSVCASRPQRGHGTHLPRQESPSLATSPPDGRSFQIWWPRWRCRGPDFLLHLQVKLLPEPSQEDVCELVVCPSVRPWSSSQDGHADKQDKCMALSKTMNFSVLEVSGLLAWGSRSSERPMADSPEHSIFQPNT